MTDADRQAKLALIRTLKNVEEVTAYEDAARARPGGLFDGELAALMARLREVGK